MRDEPPRTRAARAAAELALVRIVHHYGRRPEFVLLGGLVPDLLCSGATHLHAGTTDIDVQVDLEIAGGSLNAARLERALRNAEFSPDTERVWREAEVPVTGLAGYLLAKMAAARERRKEKDLYDVAFVVLHNDAGGITAAGDRIIDRFGTQLGAHRTALLELQANFRDPDAQGPRAYAEQLWIDRPDTDRREAAADAVFAIASLTSRLLGHLP